MDALNTVLHLQRMLLLELSYVENKAERAEKEIEECRGQRAKLMIVQEYLEEPPPNPAPYPLSTPET